MSFYVVPQELVGLPNMPSTERNCLTKLNKLAGGLLDKKRRRDVGKGFEYHVSLLPKETREALMLQRVAATAPAVVEEPEALEGELLLAGERAWDSFTQRQRDCASARLAFVREMERMATIMNQTQAIRHLVQLSAEGELPERLVNLVPIANEKGDALSRTSFMRWLSLYRAGGQIALVPGKREASMDIPGWWPTFAPFWQKPQKPSQADAYRCYVNETPGPHAKEHQVRYFMSKLSEEARNAGRMSAQELKKFQAFKQLRFEHLLPNDVWQIDGHTFDAMVINPIISKPFRPEVTCVIDWATKKWVGFSINLSEQAISTVDALRDAVIQHGMFNLAYTDNGPGFKENAVVDQMVDAMGGRLTVGIPGNAQGHGVVERSHRSNLVRLAKRYPSYMGKDMDRAASTKVHKITKALLEEGTREARQRLAAYTPELMTFYQDLLAEQETYNNTPHSSLPQYRDMETGKLCHMTPNEVWLLKEEQGFRKTLGSVEMVEMFCRPFVVRVVKRGFVQFINQTYFHRELVALHGDDVKVHYDFRDGGRVWVCNLDGELVCVAIFEGNTVDAKPQSLIELQAERRAEKQLGRLVTKAKTKTGLDIELTVKDPVQSRQVVDIAEQKAKGRALIEQHDVELKAKAAEQLALPSRPSKKYAIWEEMFLRQQAGEVLTETYAKWVSGYPHSTEWKVVREMLTAEGETVISYQQSA